MTAERIRATQAVRPPKGVRLLRGTVSQVSPLTVQIAGGTAVAGLAVPGWTYTVGDSVLVAWQEPGIGPVYPLTSTPTPPTAATSAFPTYSGTVASWDAGSRQTILTKFGPFVNLHLQLTYGATPPTIGSVIATLPVGFRPARTEDLVAVVYGGSFAGATAAVEVNTTGTVVLNSQTIATAANQGLFGSLTFSTV